eukprot:TRINITY_DN5060_c0_g1_i1.p1 TRINITY_DN5060_c0_g1~~TRINITY_DN5060_c0_g1_i1.p1  ORF type:complete len:971 (-),score=285.08 TRINITY_DN5060_c0_g1_i1:802-3714(-)
MAGTKRGRSDAHGIRAKDRAGKDSGSGSQDGSRRRSRKPATKIVNGIKIQKMAFTAPARAKGPKLRIEDLEEESSGESFERTVRDVKEREYYEQYERKIYLETQAEQRKKVSKKIKRDIVLSEAVLQQNIFQLPTASVRIALDKEALGLTESEPSTKATVIASEGAQQPSFREIPPEGKDPNRAKSHAFRQRYNRGLIRSAWVAPETNILQDDKADAVVAKLKRRPRPLGAHLISPLEDGSPRRNFKMSDRVGEHFHPKTWYDVEKCMFRAMFACVGRDWKAISRLMGSTKSPTEVKKLYYEYRLKPLLADLTQEQTPVDPDYRLPALPIKPAPTCAKDTLPRATPVASNAKKFRVFRTVSVLTSRPISDASLFQSGTLADSDRFLGSSLSTSLDPSVLTDGDIDICGPPVGSVVFAKQSIPDKKSGAWFEAVVVDRRYSPDQEGGLHLRVLLENTAPHEAFWVSQDEWSCELAPAEEVWTNAPEATVGQFDLFPLPLDSIVGPPPKKGALNAVVSGAAANAAALVANGTGTAGGKNGHHSSFAVGNGNGVHGGGAHGTTGAGVGAGHGAGGATDSDDEFIDITSTTGDNETDGASQLRSALLSAASRCLEFAHGVTMTLLNSLTTPPSPALFDAWACVPILCHIARVPTPAALEAKNLGGVVADSISLNDPITERDLIFMSHVSIFDNTCDIDIDVHTDEQYLTAHFDAIIASADAAVEWALAKIVSSSTQSTTGGKSLPAAPKAVVMHANGCPDHSDGTSQTLPAKIIESILLASSAVSSTATDGSGRCEVSVRGQSVGPYTSTLAQSFIGNVYDTIQPRRLAGGSCSINGLAFFGNEVPEDKVPSQAFQQALIAKKFFLAKRELRLEISRLYRVVAESVSEDYQESIHKSTGKTKELLTKLQSHADTLKAFHRLAITVANKRLEFMRSNYLTSQKAPLTARHTSTTTTTTASSAAGTRGKGRGKKSP